MVVVARELVRVKPVVERELETMDSDINQIRAIVINDAGEASSSDEEET